MGFAVHYSEPRGVGIGLDVGNVNDRNCGIRSREMETGDWELETARILRAAVGRQPSAASRKLLAVSRKLIRPRASGIAYCVPERLTLRCRILTSAGNRGSVPLRSLSDPLRSDETG